MCGLLDKEVQTKKNSAHCISIYNFLKVDIVIEVSMTSPRDHLMPYIERV